MDHSDVSDRSSFARYVAQLRAELHDPEKRQEWENLDLSSFLEAMAAWAEDCRQPANNNPWRHAAEVVTAATVYE
ncbi:DUF7660 family protein [Sphingomonas zeicaulis]|uniref:DUF7660 family protein n=1 Tax=Sphingomonas zeicaulis TaxID=1632740 RepID=UPI003D22A4B0